MTNGEFNGLRMRGNSRPLHVLQVRSDARSKIARTSVKSLLAMLTPKGKLYKLSGLSVLNNIYLYIDNCNKYSVAVNGDGSITAEQPNDAVSESTLRMILEWKRCGVDMKDIIDRLRAKTVPCGYPVHPWKPG